MLHIDLEKIRTLRDAKGYSQEYMAEVLGISRNAYGKIERGESKASLQRLEQIADALELSLEELLNGQVVIYQVNKDNTSSSHFQSYNSSNNQEIALLQQENVHLKETVLQLQREGELQRRIIEQWLDKQG